MNIPFTAEQFFNVFAEYNTSIWPMQILLNLLGLTAVVVLIWQVQAADGLITAILAFLWVWMGLIYQLIFFTSINKLAYAFAGLFILQGFLFFSSSTVSPKLSFKLQGNSYTLVGSIFILYGLLIYPLLGYLLGHVYPYAPTFGVPCPTAIFTFGLLLWTDSKFPKYLLIIPLLWSVIGFSAAFQWGVWEDLMLLMSALVATAMVLYRDKIEKQLTPSFST